MTAPARPRPVLDEVVALCDALRALGWPIRLADRAKVPGKVTALVGVPKIEPETGPCGNIRLRIALQIHLLAPSASAPGALQLIDEAVDGLAQIRAAGWRTTAGAVPDDIDDHPAYLIEAERTIDPAGSPR